jgi:hypothetical protein
MLVQQHSVAAMEKLSLAIASLAQNMSPPSAPPAPAVARQDFQFQITRNSDGLVSSVALLSNDRLAATAVFNRDKDHRVTSITTRNS